MHYTVELDPKEVHNLVRDAVVAGCTGEGVRLIRDKYGLSLKSAVALYRLARKGVVSSITLALGEICQKVQDEGYTALNDGQAKIFNAAAEAREEFLAARLEERAQ